MTEKSDFQIDYRVKQPCIWSECPEQLWESDFEFDETNVMESSC